MPSVFFNDTATTEIYTLSLHDALPICRPRGRRVQPRRGCRRGRGCPLRLQSESAWPLAEFNRLRPGPAGYALAMGQAETTFEQLLETLKRSSAALRDAGVPFVLGGGVAIWARGGPETEHDLDYFVKPDDAERRVQAPAAAGFRPEKPPEGWLYKAWDDHVLVDLIFDPTGVTVDDAFIEGAQETEGYAARMRVLRPEDGLVTQAPRAKGPPARLGEPARDPPRRPRADRLGRGARPDGGIAVREGLPDAGGRTGGERLMRVVVVGGTGDVGTSLLEALVGGPRSEEHTSEL